MDSCFAVQPFDLFGRLATFDAVGHAPLTDAVAVVAVPPLASAARLPANTAVETYRPSERSAHTCTDHGSTGTVKPAAATCPPPPN